MKTAKRILVVLATVALLVGALAVSAFAADETKTIDFSKITGSVQYKQETHDLNDGVTLNIVNCHINGELRIYSSSTNNGTAIFYADGKIFRGISFNAGNKADTLNVYGSTDGEDWTLIEGLSVTSSYKDVSVQDKNLSGVDYTYIKLDVNGTNQVRIKTATFEFDVPAGVCDHTNATTTSVDATCTKPGSTTVDCNDCDYVKVTEIPVKGHNYVDGICATCGAEKPAVPDYSGRYYIATNRSSGGSYFYMTSDLGTAVTKRYQAIDSKLTTLPENITAPEKGYVFVIEKNDDDTYYIYAESVDGDNNYLGWSSGNSGALVAKGSAKKLNIVEKEDGIFNINLVADSSRFLSLNGTSGNNYFAWYGGTQKQNLSLIPVEENPVKFSGVSLNIANDIDIRFYATLPEGFDSENTVVEFDFKGEKTTATWEMVDGRMMFVFQGINPAQMGDIVTAKITAVYEDAKYEATKEMSVKKYYQMAQAWDTTNGDTKLMTLLSDLLMYGAAAQTYTNYKTDALVTKGLEQLSYTNGYEAPTEGIYEPTDNSVFKSVTLALGSDITVIFTAELKAGDVVTVNFNGTTKTYTASEDGINTIKFTNIKATAYDLPIKASANGSTITYSVNSYIVEMDDGNDSLAALVQALNNYGMSAKAYQKDA